MNVDETPDTDEPDFAAERFAAAAEGRPVPGDPELTRELAVVRRLTERSAALDPTPEARERARRRLLAALAGTASDNGPSRAS